MLETDAGTTALMVACCNNDTQMVQLLLDSRADPNLKSNTGWTALIYSALFGNPKTVQLFLNYKADVNIKKDSNGATALIYACRDGHMKIVKLLLKKSADPKQQMNDGATPLYIASAEPPTVVERLLEAKADPNIPVQMEQHHCTLLVRMATYK